MFLDVALDLVLHQVGGDGVQHRAEDEVLDACFAGGIDDGEAHLPLVGVDGRADVVDRLDSTDGSGRPPRGH